MLESLTFQSVIYIEIKWSKQMYFSLTWVCIFYTTFGTADLQVTTHPCFLQTAATSAHLRLKLEVGGSFSSKQPVTSKDGVLHPENPQSHANQDDHTFVFTLRTLVKLPRPLRVCISKKPPCNWRMSPLRSNMGHSIITMVEVVGVHRPSSGAGCRVGGTKRVLNFYCICSEMQRVVLNLRA